MTPAEGLPLLAADEAARARALELGSFLVEAPAGAGKTELIAQRYLRLLAEVAEPEQIVAITFTNKAAAEMRRRIQDSLAQAACGREPQQAHKKVTARLASAALAAARTRGWNLGEEPGRLRIITVDALCASIARQMPLLSRFGSQPRVAEAPARHYEEAARRAILRLEGQGGDVVAQALRYFDNDARELCRLLAAMLARRDQWLPQALEQGLCAQAEQALALLIRRDIAAAAAHLGDERQERILALARHAAGNLGQAAATTSYARALAALSSSFSPLPAHEEALPQWRGLCDFLLTGQGTLRRRYTAREGFPAKESAACKEALAALGSELAAMPGAEEAIGRIRTLPQPHYANDAWQAVEALGKLLKLAAAELWQVFNEKGEADFIEVAQQALVALGDPEQPSDLALQLDYAIRHLLVDEFQDTSPAQVELLRRLTAGWEEGDGRTLFVVGDPMQSIYRFRKADVGLFLRAAEAGIGDVPLERLRLYRNNRSSAAVIAWVNESFAHVLPQEDDAIAGAISYRHCVATRDDEPGAGVKLHPLLVARETPGRMQAELEAERVVGIIAGEQARGGDIAVLVRSRAHLAALVNLLRRRHPELPFGAVEIEALGERQAVEDLLSLTLALTHRADRVNWLAILRAPWCGLTLADLHALAGDDHQATLWQLMNDAARVERLSADGQARLAHARSVLAEALAQQGRLRLRRWIEGVWLQLGGAACLGATDLADARAYLDLIDRLDAEGRFARDSLSAEVAELYASAEAPAGALQLMTIHKAKGLEFDTVILPGLHRKVRGADEPLMLWEAVALEGLREQLVVAPMPRPQPGAKTPAEPSPYQYLRCFEQARNAHEEARLLYVAATRARRSLHLVGVAACDAEGVGEPAAGTFLAHLWPVVREAFAARAEELAGEGSTVPLGAAAAIPSAASFRPKLLRVARPQMPPPLLSDAHPVDARPKARLLEDQGVAAAAGRLDVPALEATLEATLEASVGTLVHRYLQLVARDGVEAWSVERAASVKAAMAAWLVRQGHGEKEAGEGADRAAACLATSIASAEGRWVLSRHDQAVAELALRQRQGDGHALHVVDRSFVADGCRWIIDYKTTPLAGDAALLAHAAAHRPQLLRYASLFDGEGLPVRLCIFYAACGRLIEVPEAPAA